MEGWCTLLPAHWLGASFPINCPASSYTLCRPSEELSCSFIPSGRGQEGGAPSAGVVGRLLRSSRPAALRDLSRRRAEGLKHLWDLKMSVWGRPGLRCGSGHLRCWHIRLEKGCPALGMVGTAQAHPGAGFQAGCIARSEVPRCHTLSQVPFCCWAASTVPPALLQEGKQPQQRADTTSSSP